MCDTELLVINFVSNIYIKDMSNIGCGYNYILDLLEN